MGYVVEKTLLFDSDGSADWVINPISGRIHYFPLDADTPPSLPIDTNSTAEYAPARFSKLNIAKYDHWGLSIASKVHVAGVLGVGANWDPSPLGVFATGVVVGANKEQDPELNAPYSQTPLPTTTGTHFALDEWYATTNKTAAGGVPKLIAGAIGVAPHAAALFPEFGFYTDGAISMSTDDRMKLFAWCGPSGPGNYSGAGQQGLPVVTQYDELHIALQWYPTYTGLATVTEPRIKMTIHGVGLTIRSDTL